MTSWRRALPPLAALAIALLLWSGGKLLFAVPDFVLPSPLGVVRAGQQPGCQ